MLSIVLENVSGDIEMDSGAEVRCLPVIVGRVSTARRGSACVEVTTFRLVAANSMIAVLGFWCVKLLT